MLNLMRSESKPRLAESGLPHAQRVGLCYECMAECLVAGVPDQFLRWYKTTIFP